MRLLPWVLVLAACGGGEDPVVAAPEDPPALERDATDGPAGALGTWSNAGGFYARWRPVEGEVPLNQEFSAEVWLSEDEAGTKPLADADVWIDCRMPAHRHGMLQDVALVHQGGGRYLAEGMLCHMLGHWELTVDLTRGALTERAQWDLEVE